MRDGPHDTNYSYPRGEAGETARQGRAHLGCTSSWLPLMGPGVGKGGALPVLLPATSRSPSALPPAVCLLQGMWGRFCGGREPRARTPGCRSAVPKPCNNMLRQPVFLTPRPHKLSAQVGLRSSAARCWTDAHSQLLAACPAPGHLPVTCQSLPRMCRTQSGGTHNSCAAPALPCTCTARTHAPLLPPQDVMAAMRNHFEGSRHDPYTLRNPGEPFRPIALLRTAMGHGEALAAGGPRCSPRCRAPLRRVPPLQHGWRWFLAACREPTAA